MISLDRGLLGKGISGDAALRHQKYADLAGTLDIIVFASGEHERIKPSQNLEIIPTRSTKRRHFHNAFEIAVGLAKRQPYDLLVTQEFAAPVGEKIKIKLSLPWIVNVHSMFFGKQWLRLSPLNWYLFYRIKKAIPQADGFRVNNEEIKNKLLSWGVKKPILVQPTPVDIRKFSTPSQSPPIPIHVGTGGEGVRLLYVGRLSPEKNVALLIKAFKAIPGDVELYIVGEGPEEEKLKDLAKGDGRIKFLGSKTHEELIPIYQAADIFVLPSNTESYGKVLIEAGAAGCALVATRTPGARSLIADGRSGILVNIGDEEGLRGAISKIIADQELRKALSEGAREMAEGHDLERAINNTISFWKTIATSPALRAPSPRQGREGNIRGIRI